MDKGKEMLEYINGEVFRIDSESMEHQNVLINLKSIFNCYFRDKQCKVFAAPFAFWLNENKICPDIAVFYGNGEIESTGIPNIIVEVISYDNQSHDRLVKYVIYAEAGVKEYWLVNANLKVLEIYVLKDGEYKQVAILKEHEYAISQTFPGLSVSLTEVFK